MRFLVTIAFTVMLALPAAAQDFDKGLEAARRGDYAAALNEWRPLADEGDKVAQYNVGLMYAKGWGVPQDHAEAAKWYRLSAEQGYLKAQTNLGRMYVAGWGVPKDDALALKWYRKAAEQGGAVAQNNIGTLYRDGRGVEQDLAEAVKWYRKAVDKGAAVAQSNLGLMYLQGLGVEKDAAEAVTLFRKAADQGYAKAQYNLGVVFRDGLGMPQDHGKAVAWFTKAAERGYLNALNNLGFMYFKGQGVAKDPVEALKWFSLAAARGHEGATKGRDHLTKNLAPDDVSKARRLARIWLQKHGQAPAPGAKSAAKAPTPMEREARALLRAFLDPTSDKRALTRALRPLSADYAAVYEAPLAAALEARNKPLWDSGQPLGPKAGQTELLVVYATTDQLIDGAAVLDDFPGGYKDVLVHMKPGVPIVRFKFVEPGKRLGMAFDGLVHVNGRWVLMPKPWRAL